MFYHVFFLSPYLVIIFVAMVDVPAMGYNSVIPLTVSSEDEASIKMASYVNLGLVFMNYMTIRDPIAWALRNRDSGLGQWRQQLLLLLLLFSIMHLC